jgi:hypothetical protein
MLFVAGATVVAQGQAAAANPPGDIVSGTVAFRRMPIECRSGAVTDVVGAVMDGPQLETLFPDVATQRSLIAVGDDGYALITGTAAFSGGLLRGGSDILLMRIGPDFTPRWGSVLGGPAPDMPVSLARTADGGFALVSSTTSDLPSSMRWLASGPEAVLLSRHDADGRLLWAQYHWPREMLVANAVVTWPGGGIAYGGTLRREGRWAGFLMRHEDGGALKWLRVLGPDHEVGVTWIVPLPDGGLYAFGPRQRVARPGVKVQGLAFDIWIARFDADGAVRWARSLTLASGVATVMGEATATGGLLIAREGRYDAAHDTTRFPMVELSPDGRLVWAAEYEAQGEARVTAILPLAEGGFRLFGPASPADGENGPFALTIDAQGRPQSTRWIDASTMLSTDARRAFMERDPVSVVRDADGRYVLFGDAMSIPRSMLVGKRLPSNLRQNLKAFVYLLRTDTQGDIPGCSRAWPVTSRTLDLTAEPFAIEAVDAPGPRSPQLPLRVLDPRRLEPR